MLRSYLCRLSLLMIRYDLSVEQRLLALIYNTQIMRVRCKIDFMIIFNDVNPGHLSWYNPRPRFIAH